MADQDRITGSARPGGRFSSLLVDPPWIDRITWREGVSPRTLISRDTGLMARTFGTLYLVAALVGGLSLIVADPGNPERCPAGGDVRRLIPRRRNPLRRLPANPDVSVPGRDRAGQPDDRRRDRGGIDRGRGGLCGLLRLGGPARLPFFSFPAAALQTILAAGSYAVVLIARHTEFGLSYVLGLVAVSGAAGAVVGLLRTRVETLARNLTSQAHTDPVTAIANRRSRAAPCRW